MRQGCRRAIALVLVLVLTALAPRSSFADRKLDEAGYRKTIELCVLVSIWPVVDFSPKAKTELGRSLNPSTLPETAELAFTVERSGDFKGLRMTRSSGNAELDAALLDTIKAKAPFLPLPTGVGTSSLSFKVTLPLREDAVSRSVVALIDSLGLQMFDAFDIAKVGTETQDWSPPPQIIPPDYEKAVLDRVYAQSAPVDAVLNGNAEVQVAMDKGRSLGVFAAFAIDRDGKVLLSRILESSGIEALDEAVLAAIAKGEPYPPAPPENKDPSLAFGVPFIFRAPPELATPGLQEDYVDEVQGHLLDNISELEQAIRYERGLERYAGGDVLNLSVELTIARSGTLEEVRIAAPSGHPALDDALLRTAREAAPYPPIPGALGLDTAIVTLNFAYRLHY